MKNRFEQPTMVLTSLINYFEELQYFLQNAQTNPEIFLTESFLQYDADRNYLFTNLLACYGEDGLNQFLLDYFECVIEALKCKIPISDMSLQMFSFNGQFGLLGLVKNTPIMFINTFTKTVQYLPDEQRLELEQSITKSENFINQLMEELESLKLQKGGFLKAVNKKAYEEKLKATQSTIMGQIYAEKNTLRTLQENLEYYDNQVAEILQIRDRYFSRLKTYFNFQLT